MLEIGDNEITTETVSFSGESKPVAVSDCSRTAAECDAARDSTRQRLLDAAAASATTADLSSITACSDRANAACREYRSDGDPPSWNWDCETTIEECQHHAAKNWYDSPGSTSRCSWFP